MGRRLMTKFRGAWVLALAFSLSACSGSSWLGGNTAPPLPGKRISVLAGEKALKPETKGDAAPMLLPPPESNDEWPMAGGFANHAMHHMEVGDALQRLWSANIGTGGGKRAKLLSQPIVADGLVFTLDAVSEVRAFNAATGKNVWKTDVAPKGEDDSLSGGGIAYDEGQIFVATGFAQVVSLDAKSGKVQWRQTLSGPMRGAPTVRGGRVFVITVDNQTHCLSAEDGSVQWTHQGISEAASMLGGSSPAVDGNVVVVPYSSGELFALRVDNGAMLWQDQLSTVRRTDNVTTLTDIRGRPIIDRGRVYAIGHANLLVAIDLRTGRRLWDREVGGLQSPWLAGDYLFLLTNDNEAVALEAKTGRVLWVTQLQVWEDEEDKEGRIVWAGPVLASDRLIVGSSHRKLASLSPYTGEVLGMVKASDGVGIAPSVAGGVLYVLSNDGDLVAYR